MAISKITGAGLSGAETIHDTIALNSIKQTDAQNLTGTYSSHELVMGKTFTLTGDVTVNENLVLANMSGVGTDIIIQDDGTARTINSTGGTGIIEGVSKAFTRTSLTGMTGALGSVVTGTPAITDAPALTGLGTVTSGTYNSTIGSSATFPAGHIIQVVRSLYDTNNDHSNNATFDNSGTLTITPKRADTSLWMSFDAVGSAEGASGNKLQMGINTAADGTGTWVSFGVGGNPYNVLKRQDTSDAPLGIVSMAGYVASTGSTSARSYYLVWSPEDSGQNCNVSDVMGIIMEYVP